MRVTAGLSATPDESVLENITNFAALGLADDKKDIQSLKQIAASCLISDWTTSGRGNAPQSRISL